MGVRDLLGVVEQRGRNRYCGRREGGLWRYVIRGGFGWRQFGSRFRVPLDSQVRNGFDVGLINRLRRRCGSVGEEGAAEEGECGPARDEDAQPGRNVVQVE
ncbi:hypothetical protein ACS04_30040, partial [Streptomyces roseus]